MLDKIVVIAAFIERNGRFLIAQRKKGVHLELMWELPGGKLDENESEKECLRRELKEELGIDSTIGSLFYENEYRYPNKHIFLKTYKVYIKGKIKRLTSHERIDWISPEEISEYGFAPADIPVLGKINEELKSAKTKIRAKPGLALGIRN